MFNAYRDSFNKMSAVNPFDNHRVKLTTNRFRIRGFDDLTTKFMISTIRTRFFYNRFKALDSNLEVATNNEEHTRTVSIDTNYCGTKLQKLRKG